MKRQTLIAALALLAAGAAHAAVTEFIVYKQPDFKGPSHVVKGEVNILDSGFAREAESLVVRGGYWEACTEDRFHGTCRVLGEGRYPRLDGDLNRKIVSVRYLGTDPKVARRDDRDTRRGDRGGHRRGAIELYGREGFNGRTLRVEENVADLLEKRFDGRASSLVVHEGTWELCTRPEFEGRCRRFGPGEYPRLAGLDDRVNSVRQVR